MIMFQLTSRMALWLLIVLGLFGGLSLSYSTLTGEAPCPSLLAIPLCYLVSFGYILMLFAQFIRLLPLKNKVFYSGWGIVFLIAVAGTILELLLGNACPKGPIGVPLCYVSFLFCMLIIALYRFIEPNKK